MAKTTAIGICLPCGVGNRHEACSTRTGEAHIGCACPVCGPTEQIALPRKLRLAKERQILVISPLSQPAMDF